MEIKLTAEQEKIHKELLQIINRIEIQLMTEIDPKDTNLIQSEILQRGILLSYSAKCLSWATALFDNAHGQLAEYMLTNEQMHEAKQTIISSWMKGKLAKWNALYVRTESVLKKLDRSIEGLISVLAYERELMRNELRTNQ